MASKARPMAPTSDNKWPASARRARLLVKNPAEASIMARAHMIPSARINRLRLLLCGLFGHFHVALWLCG